MLHCLTVGGKWIMFTRSQHSANSCECMSTKARRPSLLVVLRVAKLKYNDDFSLHSPPLDYQQGLSWSQQNQNIFAISGALRTNDNALWHTPNNFDPDSNTETNNTTITQRKTYDFSCRPRKDSNLKSIKSWSRHQCNEEGVWGSMHEVPTLYICYPRSYSVKWFHKCCVNLRET